MDSRFHQTIAEIDQINVQDPNLKTVDGKQIPKELLYSQRMTEVLAQFCPEASETLQIAARAQHIKRWSIPRETYSMDRKGYLQWRTQLKIFHAELAAGILKKFGYDAGDIQKVEDLINKKRLKTDPEVQTLEDVICIVFLRYYFDDFIAKHANEEEKIIDIVQKIWKKMSEKGHEAALAMPHSEKALSLVTKALKS
ncbi:MAG: DUF4202 domain-containing protein [Cyclobacteriaceae bacterium]